jgi:MFS family permease
MMTDRQVASQIASLTITAAGVSLIAGRIVAGFLLDYLFAPHVALVFFSMPLAGILILLTTSSVLCAVLAAVLVGMGLGAEVDLIAYLQSRYIGMRRFGETYGYFLAIFMAGSGVGPFVMGLSYSRTGSYVLALAVLAAGLTAACITMLTLGQYRFAVKVERHAELTGSTRQEGRSAP